MPLRLITFGGLRLEGEPQLPPLGPRRMALLALVAAAGRGGISRDRVIGILWPESSQENARHALSQSCYSLKQDTGVEWVTPGPELRLDPAIASDIGEWLEALSANDTEAVVTRYPGQFLDGFYLSGAGEFERWVDAERARVVGAVIGAAEQLATAADHRGDHPRSVRWWTRLTELDPLSARFATGRMRALVRAGDQASALIHAQRYEKKVRDELDTEVDPTVRNLVAALRRPEAISPRGGEPVGLPSAPRIAIQPVDASATASATPAPAGRRPGRLGLLAGAGLLVVVAVVLGWPRNSPAAPQREPASASTPVVLASHQPRSLSREAMLLYDQGLRAHFRRDAPDAFRLMSAALERDSLFVMAAYHAWVASQSLPDPTAAHQALHRLQRRLPRADDREQLMIRASLTLRTGAIGVAVAIAETLTVRYPADLDGQVLLGQAQAEAGDWAGAVATTARVVTNDSLSLVPESPYCRACSALGVMARAYLWWDSVTAAERVARRLVAARPADAWAWHELVEPLLRQGRRDEAEAAVERMADLTAGPVVPGPLFNRDLIRWGRLEEVERILAPDLLSPSSEIRTEARWLSVLQLRDQGRLTEALALARDGVVPGGRPMHPGLARDPKVEALLLVEMGRPAEAARLFRQEGERVLGAEGAPPGVRARGGGWYLTLAGVASGRAGDTAAVRRLADSVEVIGRESTFGRDALLHHMLRGVLAQMRGRHGEAVGAFRRALFSPTDGYTRTNLLLARSLLALQRSDEAIATLRSALRGGVDGGNSHVSRTELHEALADAFLQAGQADSAAAHYVVVERNWRRADPPFLERYRRARSGAGGSG